MPLRWLPAVLSLVITCLHAPGLLAQERTGKYNSQLWEITGKGMKKPSYLFGTMHISNKLAFHLGDSFFTAIRNVEVVALEQNPEIWQSTIPRMTEQSTAYQRFAARYDDDYLKETSFAFEGFKGDLRALVAKEPGMNNALLYRSEEGAEDFEENTYLDLYIYQTGRKLGKAAAGVEEYMTTERLRLEAYQDALKAPKKPRPQSRELNQYEILQGIQDAYRKGNLDALDSLNTLTLFSDAYREKFLYRRNEIQADAMDSIMKRQALFVGVGAAHLPGERGVIELLRKKGYRLRPVRMADYDAAQKEAIDSIRVPVVFSRQWSSDSAFSVLAPGPLAPLDGSEVQTNFADMANGAFYLVTRMKTMPLYSGYTETRVMRIIDSLLYEAVPGKILSRKEVMRDGYKGFELQNRTRRGDLQRYSIFVTPSEIFVFKMGGTENYVAGPEADSFFNSIRLRPRAETGSAPLRYAPADAGFSVVFPSAPLRRYTRSGPDNQPRLELEAIDPATGDTYMLIRKDMYSFSFLEEDSFEVSLMTESFLKDELIGKTVRRKAGKHMGYASQDLRIEASNGDQIRARGVVQGPHEYLLAVRARRSSPAHDLFFNSLQFHTAELGPASRIQDTFIHIEASSPVRIRLDTDIASLLDYTRQESRYNAISGEAGYDRGAEQRNGNFLHEPSGEFIIVNTKIYPEYYYARDSARFWRNELRDATADSSMVLRRIDYFRLGDSTTGCNLLIADTNSTRLIRKKLMLKGHHFFTIQTVLDSRRAESEFSKAFFASAKPFACMASPGIFQPKTELYFTHYYSNDTTLRKRARSAISSVFFGTPGFPGILEAIRRLDRNRPDYYDMKTKWIAELGYLKDRAIAARVSAALDSIYHASGDTTVFQNAVLQALAQQRTGTATALFKQLLTEDPPVFDNNGQRDYHSLFEHYNDSLRLAAELFPDLLQLAPIPEYKQPVLGLLARLADSSYVKPELYRSQIPTLLFDARIALKKQVAADEQTSQSKHGTVSSDFNPFELRGLQDTALGSIYDYAVLLAPFYSENPGIPKFFERTLQLQPAELRARVALLLLRQGKPVSETIWARLNEDRAYRSRLYTLVHRAGRPDLLRVPQAWQQHPLTESAMRLELGRQADTLVFVTMKPAKLGNRSGRVFFYKYKMRDNADWQLAYLGLQPDDNAGFNDEPELLVTGRPIPTEKKLDEAVSDELRRALVRRRAGGRYFYSDNEPGLDWAHMLREMQRRDN